MDFFVSARLRKRDRSDPIAGKRLQPGEELSPNGFTVTAHIQIDDVRRVKAEWAIDGKPFRTAIFDDGLIYVILPHGLHFEVFESGQSLEPYFGFLLPPNITKVMMIPSPNETNRFLVPVYGPSPQTFARKEPSSQCYVLEEGAVEERWCFAYELGSLVGLTRSFTKSDTIHFKVNQRSSKVPEIRYQKLVKPGASFEVHRDSRSVGGVWDGGTVDFRAYYDSQIAIGRSASSSTQSELIPAVSGFLLASLVVLALVILFIRARAKHSK
ncbi:MAG: hypothetical protein SFX74_10575 [Fimbriimonadaceae bacterium]|nr:hypothetical protein [Fimbriimonadaceae bacterium]